MENRDLCTVLVNSCDKYEDTWEPFFILFEKYWPDCKFPIVLNTETKQFDYKNLNIKVSNVIGKRKNISWGKRLKSVLKRINTKYIIFMLDDFFLMDYVDSNRIDEIIEWMENDNNIAVFSLFRVEDNNHKDIKSKKYKDFYLRNQHGDYRYNCQIAVWNRKELIKSLRSFESAWDWELMGNVRSYRNKKKFYTLMNPDKYIFKYDYEKCGIVRGKWMLPYVKELFDKENIKIDFSIRNNNSKEVNSKTEKEFVKRIKYYFKKIRSLV